MKKLSDFKKKNTSGKQQTDSTASTLTPSKGTSRDKKYPESKYVHIKLQQNMNAPKYYNSEVFDADEGGLFNVNNEYMRKIPGTGEVKRFYLYYAPEGVSMWIPVEGGMAYWNTTNDRWGDLGEEIGNRPNNETGVAYDDELWELYSSFAAKNGYVARKRKQGGTLDYKHYFDFFNNKFD